MLSRGSGSVQHHRETAGGVALGAGHLHQEAAQLQLLAVAVLQLDTPVARHQELDREGGVTDEVGVSEHVLVVNTEPDQSHLRVENPQVEGLVPDGVEPVVRDGLGLVLHVVVVAAQHLQLHQGRHEALPLGAELLDGPVEMSGGQDSDGQLQRGDSSDLCGSARVGGKIAGPEHELRPQEEAALAVVQELGLVDLHGFVSSLVVEGGHLTATAPHGQRVVVVTAHPLGLGVDPGDLVTVVLEEPLRVTLGAAHQLLRLGLGEGGHLGEVSRHHLLLAEHDGLAVDHQVAQLQGDPQGPLPPPALGVPEEGAGGDLLDLVHPVLGLPATVAPQLRPGQAGAGLQSEAAQPRRGEELHLGLHDVDGSCREKSLDQEVCGEYRNIRRI